MMFEFMLGTATLLVQKTADTQHMASERQLRCGNVPFRCDNTGHFCASMNEYDAVVGDRTVDKVQARNKVGDGNRYRSNTIEQY